MPELPEVETIKRGLTKALKNDAIVGVEVLREQSIAFPSVEKFVSSLPGHKFKTVIRRGKYLLIELDGGVGLACHLRMSGRLLIREEKSKAEPRFLRVRFLLASGRELHFEDMRVFGRLWFKPKGKTFEDIIPTLLKLGAEPLDELNSKHLSDAFKGKKQAVKTALLDQHILAGVGNIYADESLFLSGIHPTAAASTLTAAKLKALVENIRLVLNKAIISGGSSLRDYTDSSGVNGRYQNQSWVYGREGKPCRKCKTLVERIKLNGRSSHFCPRCQSSLGAKK